MDIAKFYIDMGIDGFRFDAVKYVYYGDANSSVDFWEWYVDELQAYKPDIYCVGECWSGESEILQYYEALNCFDFAIGGAEGVVARTAKGGDISVFTYYIERYQNAVEAANEDGIPMFFLSNHDQDRIAGAFIDPMCMKMAANLYLLSPGSPFIYYGEEIGIRGSRGSANTDANRRLAMLWGDEENEVKNPVGANYPEANQIKTTVADQINDENSLYNYYCKLIAIRNKHKAIGRGIYNSVGTSEKNLAGFLVDYQGEKLVIMHNTSTSEISYDLSECADLDGYTVKELCDFIGVGNAKLEGNILTIGAQTSVILK